MNYRKLLFLTFSFCLSLFFASGANVYVSTSGSVSESAVWPFTSRTGTISSNTSNNIISGHNTKFLTEFNVGTRIATGDNTIIGKVAAIQNDSSLTLETNSSSSNTNITYTINGIGPVDVLYLTNGKRLTFDLPFSVYQLLASTSTVDTCIVTIPENIEVNISDVLALLGGGSAGNKNCIVDLRGTLNIARLIMSSNNANVYGIINIYNNAILTVSGNFSISLVTSNIINMYGNSTLNIRTSSIASPFTFNSFGGTTHFYSTGVQTIPKYIYTNLTVSGNNNKTITDSTVVMGTLNVIGTSTLVPSNRLIIKGDFTIGSTGKTTLTNSDISLNGTSQVFNNSNAANTPNFNILRLSGGDKTFTSTNINYNNTIDIAANANLVGSGNTNMTFTGSFSHTGSGKFKFGTCGNANTNLFFSGGSNVNSFGIDETYKYVIGLNINKTSGTSLSLSSSISIEGSLVLTSGVLNIEKNLIIEGSSSSISRTSGTITMMSTAGLFIGDCSTLGSDLTLPNDLFSTAPTFENLYINRASNVTLGNQALSITGLVQLANATFNTNGMLILKSTASKTARVAPIYSGSISGNVTVERFIPGGSTKRKWRLMCAPTSNTFGAYSISEFIDDIHVTGTGGSVNGFDNNPPNNTASIRYYDESLTGASNNGWRSPSNINFIRDKGYGVSVFVRGSRNVSNPFLNWSIPDDVVIDFTGTLNTGEIGVVVSKTRNTNTADGLQLVGNPYASPINFDTVTLGKYQVENKFWAYNPNTGMYGIYDADLGSGTNGITKYIASGQGFFVRASTTGTPGILSFYEDSKCVAEGNNYFRPSTSKGKLPFLRYKLENDSSLSDEGILCFDSLSHTHGNDAKDASKFFNDVLNIYTIAKDSSNLSIDARMYPNKIDTIPLAVYSYNGTEIMKSHHRISFEGMEDLENKLSVVLWDAYLNTYTDLAQLSTYDFRITDDSLSWGKARFYLLSASKSTGIRSHQESKIKIYPNPSTDVLYLNASEEKYQSMQGYRIIDPIGREVQSNVLKASENSSSIDISMLNNGVYLLEVWGKDFKTVLKFIKQ